MNVQEFEETLDRAIKFMRQQHAEIADKKLVNDTFADLIKKQGKKIDEQQAELTEAGHMIGMLREYISDLENGLESSINLNKAQAERNEK